MTPKRVFGVLFSCVCLMVRQAAAGAFESPGLGARATSMGGAFIGMADDWTSIYWNPAGLAQLKGTGLGVDVNYLQVHAHDSSGLANPVPPLTSANIFRGDAFVQLGGEPTQFNGLDSRFGVPLPGFGFYTHWRDFALGVGSFAPLGFSFEVADHSTPGYDVSFKSQGFILNHNVSVAYPLTEYLNLGAGVSVVQAHLERTASKVAPTETMSSSAQADGLGVQGLFGMLIHLGKRVRLGGVYRTGQDVSLKGDASISDSLFPLAIPGFGTFQNESSDFTQKLRNPTTYGIGTAFSVLPSLTLAADWQRTEWNASRLNNQFDTPGLILQNQDLDLGWSSTSRYRFGAEWTPREAWSFRLGYFRDPRAVSFASEALTQLIDADQRYYTAGFSCRRNHWRWSFASQYAYGKERLGDRTLIREASTFDFESEYFF